MYFVFLKNTLQNTEWHNGKYFFQTPCPQTLSQGGLMFNKFKQDCSDVTASRKIHLTVHFDDTEQQLNWWRGRDDCVVSQKPRGTAWVIGGLLTGSHYTELLGVNTCMDEHIDIFEVVRIWMQAKSTRLTADEVLAHWRNIYDIKMYLVFFCSKKNTNTSTCISNTKYK